MTKSCSAGWYTSMYDHAGRHTVYAFSQLIKMGLCPSTVAPQTKNKDHGTPLVQHIADSFRGVEH